MIDWTNASLLFAFLSNQMKHIVAVQANLLETLTLQRVYCLIDIIIPTFHFFCYQRNIQRKYDPYYQFNNNSIFLITSYYVFNEQTKDERKRKMKWKHKQPKNKQEEEHEVRGERGNCLKV